MKDEITFNELVRFCHYKMPVKIYLVTVKPINNYTISTVNIRKYYEGKLNEMDFSNIFLPIKDLSIYSLNHYSDFIEISLLEKIIKEDDDGE